MIIPKAVKVIRDQLAVREKPSLWCMLGDLKHDKQHYERAWEVSGQRSARAMRSLGLHYLETKDWAKSIECLKLSLDKNPVQVWPLHGKNTKNKSIVVFRARIFRLLRIYIGKSSHNQYSSISSNKAIT